jgi:hypothetical protein
VEVEEMPIRSPHAAPETTLTVEAIMCKPLIPISLLTMGSRRNLLQWRSPNSSHDYPLCWL